MPADKSEQRKEAESDVAWTVGRPGRTRLRRKFERLLFYRFPCTHCDIGHFVAWDNTFAQNTCTMTMGLLSVDECQKWHHRCLLHRSLLCTVDNKPLVLSQTCPRCCPRYAQKVEKIENVDKNWRRKS